MSKNSTIFLLCYALAIGVLLAIIFGTLTHKKPDVYLNIVLQKPSIQLRGTVYPPKLTQVKKYVILASGILVRNDNNILQKHYCSMSQDMFARYKFGDTLSVISSHPKLNGKWILHDCMEAGSTRSIDFFISRSDIKDFAKGVYTIIIEE
jgi:hypothetical protein